MLKFIKSVILTAMVIMASIAIFLFAKGYNFEYIKFTFIHSCFSVDGYGFCPSRKFNIVFIYDENKGISYVRGYIPFFKKDRPDSYIILRESDENKFITVFLNKSYTPSIKDGCLKSTQCLPRDTIIFGKPASCTIASRLPDMQSIEIPSLKIVISSGLMNDDTLNEINISKISVL